MIFCLFSLVFLIASSLIGMKFISYRMNSVMQCQLYVTLSGNIYLLDFIIKISIGFRLWLSSSLVIVAYGKVFCDILQNLSLLHKFAGVLVIVIMLKHSVVAQYQFLHSRVYILFENTQKANLFNCWSNKKKIYCQLPILP